MSFFKLRLINIILVFIIGISLGLLFSGKNSSRLGLYSSAEYVPVYNKASSNSASLEYPKVQSNSEIVVKENANPMDDDDDYVLSINDQQDNGDESEVEISSKAIMKPPVYEDDTSDFFKNPKDFAQKQVSLKLQMIMTRKKDGIWRLNFVFSDEDRNLNYIYIDDPNNVSGDSPDYKIGYFYRVLINCSQGDLKNGNKLLKVENTNEKTSWASGISALE